MEVFRPMLLKIEAFRKLMLLTSVICEVSKNHPAFIRVKQFQSTVCELHHTAEGTIILGKHQ
jgi:hypothetical protein